jgi:hypothetical protein
VKFDLVVSARDRKVVSDIENVTATTKTRIPYWNAIAAPG